MSRNKPLAFSNQSFGNSITLLQENKSIFKKRLQCDFFLEIVFRINFSFKCNEKLCFLTYMLKVYKGLRDLCSGQILKKKFGESWIGSYINIII